MDSTFTLTRRSFQSSLLLILWMTLPVGIFFILSQEFFWGLIFTVVGITAIVVILSPRFAKSLEDREIPRRRGYFMAFGYGAAAVVVALFVLLLVQPSASLVLIRSLYALGILGLGTWAVIQVLKSMRQ